jgi:hypothetical protein
MSTLRRLDAAFAAFADTTDSFDLGRAPQVGQ